MAVGMACCAVASKVGRLVVQMEFPLADQMVVVEVVEMVVAMVASMADV